MGDLVSSLGRARRIAPAGAIVGAVLAPECTLFT
jgi:hypothetical protein